MQTLLPNRAVISLSGDDADTLLQGIITQDINLLQTQPIIFSAMLTAQGKFMYDFFIIKDGESRLIDIAAAHKSDFIKKLKMYKLRAKVTIEETDLQAHAAWGETPQGEGWNHDPRLESLGWRKISDAGAADNSEAYNAHRISLAIPDGAFDATERHFLLELGYDQLNGVSFNKGCFVGQEPTARMHYRKVLRKCLFAVRAGEQLPAAGTAISCDGKTLGEMRSSSGNIGLAFCRIDPVEAANAPILAGDSEITLTLPAYMNSKIAEIRAASS